MGGGVLRVQECFLDLLRDLNEGKHQEVWKDMGRSIGQEGGLEVPWMGRNRRTTVAETADSGEQFWQLGGMIYRGMKGENGEERARSL
jgi:hypothetical protein